MNQSNYFLSFALLSDEIENRVYDAMENECGNDYTVFDILDELVNRFCLDYPEESRYYHREVIESTFENKANSLLLESFHACEAMAEYEIVPEGVQLEMF